MFHKLHILGPVVDIFLFQELFKYLALIGHKTCIYCILPYKCHTDTLTWRVGYN